ncbi:MAG: hypothetical protein EOP47_16485 [Sphingobacteriaceae bacterium]|nr:MAG: hypothetical protein EOP47_16485 [Sphingobacteriaceae bacterium]
MNSFTKLIITLLVASVGFSSCQKDFTIDDQLDPVDTVAGDSNYLDRFYYLEETSGGLDTMWGYYFKYDSLKRVSELHYNEEFPVNSFELEKKYSYHNSDTIPYKMEEFDGPTDIYPEEYYFTFDSQQRISKDSIRHYNNSGDLDRLEIINYSYATGEIYAHTKITEYFLPIPDEYIEHDTATLNSFGDILTHKKYREQGSVSVLHLTSEFTYGTQSGPFAKSSIFKAHHLLPMGETFIDDLMTHKNLLTQLEQDENGTATMDEAYTDYQYNAAGLVKEFKTGDAGFRQVIRFFYKNL